MDDINKAWIAKAKSLDWTKISAPGYRRLYSSSIVLLQKKEPLYAV